MFLPDKARYRVQAYLAAWLLALTISGSKGHSLNWVDFIFEDFFPIVCNFDRYTDPIAFPASSLPDEKMYRCQKPGPHDICNLCRTCVEPVSNLCLTHALTYIFLHLNLCIAIPTSTPNLRASLWWRTRMVHVRVSYRPN